MRHVAMQVHHVYLPALWRPGLAAGVPSAAISHLSVRHSATEVGGLAEGRAVGHPAPADDQPVSFQRGHCVSDAGAGCGALLSPGLVP